MSKKRVSLQNLAINFKMSKIYLNEEKRSIIVDLELCKLLESEAEKCFNIIYETLKNTLYRYTMQVFSNYSINDYLKHEYAQEAVTETFLIFNDKIEQFDENYKITTWIYKIAQNEAFKIRNREIKKRVDTNFTDLFGGEDILSDDEDFVSRFLNDATTSEYFHVSIEYEEVTDSPKIQYEDLLNRKYQCAISCIEELPQKYQDIIRDKYINDIRQVDLERLHGLNLNTIKTRDRKARADLNTLYKIKSKEIFQEV